MFSFDFWYGVVFTLLMETAVMIFATDWLRKKVRNVKKDSVSG